jgi:pimeloyl-ACP methyl ester carboxylesterase
MNRLIVLLAVLLALPPAAAGAAPAERTVPTAPSVNIRTVVFAPPTVKMSVVLVPGFLATAEVWADTAKALADGRGVVAIDPRSQGGSSKVMENNTPEARAGDIAAVVKALGLKRYVLVGWSQGVQDVAAYVAGRSPEGLEGVVLVDAAPAKGARGVAADPEGAAAQLGLLSIYTRAPAAYAEGMMKAIFRKPAPPNVLAARVGAAMKTPSSIGAAMLVADLYGADRSETFKAFDGPLLVIAAAGSQDLQAQKETAASAKNGRLVVVEDAGHAVFADQPDAFNKALTAFLDAIDKASR